MVLYPDVNLTSSEFSSYETVSGLPVHLLFSTGDFPAGTKIIPLKFPFRSVTRGELKVDSELPGTPVNLVSGIVHLPTSLPSIKM